MRLLLGLTILSIVTVQSGCTTDVTVEGSIPTPLVRELPIHVGIYYSEAFKTYEYKELPDKSEGPRFDYQIDLGKHNLGFFRNLSNALFREVTELEDLQLDPAQKAELDVVLVPEIVRYDPLLPSVSTLSFFAVSIEYRLTMTDPNGAVIDRWKIIGYGKAEGGMLSGGEAIGRATMLAIRDGGARIATEIPSAIEVLLEKSVPAVEVEAVLDEGEAEAVTEEPVARSKETEAEVDTPDA